MYKCLLRKMLGIKLDVELYNQKGAKRLFWCYKDLSPFGEQEPTDGRWDPWFELPGVDYIRTTVSMVLEATSYVIILSFN